MRFQAAAFDDVAPRLRAGRGRNSAGSSTSGSTAPAPRELRLERPGRAAGADGTRPRADARADAGGRPLPLARAGGGHRRGHARGGRGRRRDGRAARERRSSALPARPLRVDVDPGFDLFRRLDRDEIPPAYEPGLRRRDGPGAAAVGRAAGARRGLPRPRRRARALRPRRGRDPRGPARSPSCPATARSSCSAGRTGSCRARAAAVAGGRRGSGRREVRLERVALPRAGHAFVITARHPETPSSALLWAALDDPAAAAGLGRKLPHYNKYSYLAFEGAEPANVAKGRWPATDSPLTPRPAADGAASAAAWPDPGRAPLAALPPRFSRERHARGRGALAAPALGGRGFGTAGLDQAAGLHRGRLRRSRAAPGGRRAGELVPVVHRARRRPAARGRLQERRRRDPGNRADRRPRPAGDRRALRPPRRRRPGLLPANRGQVHPGADDNASGVAVLLELARTLAAGARGRRARSSSSPSPARRRGGSAPAHFVAGHRLPPAAKRSPWSTSTPSGGSRPKKLLVLGGASAPEWVHIFRGAGYLAGVETAMAAEDLDASDDVTFRRAGVPAVQLFGGPQPDYHRPGTTLGDRRRRPREGRRGGARDVGYLAGRQSADPGGSAPSAPGARRVGQPAR